MMYDINKENKIIKGELVLPSSKSISNRLLIIRALAKRNFEIYNLSYSDDTKNLLDILKSDSNIFDVGNAGTTMRFLTSYLANKPGEWIITGSERMKNRPIGILVNAIKELGVKIEYLEKEGFPPIKIHGTKLEGGNIEISGSISSQFISSLLLIAPTLPKGLNIKLKSRIVSKPYIDMTLNLMKKFGIKSRWEQNHIIIEKQSYRVKDFTVEADWSSASYWYEMATLADWADIKLYGLKKNSIQGDSIIAKLFEKLGIKTTFIQGGARIRKISNPKIKIFEYDFTDIPDLAQTLAVTLSMLNIPFSLCGLDTLLIKETNRIVALKNELLKTGNNLAITHDTISRFGNSNFSKNPTTTLCFKTYNDHRMVLALTPIAVLYRILIENPDVVSKSYTGYWEDIQKLGFNVNSSE
ncbi:MAG: hypothetical protein A2046_00375 [Bacteroidetes bacterium GWA2_30_7]|nr:MAG: hypothetical protein A2046_00375 [Bacteroidetes bacterium GWA2_30_7]